MPCEGVAEQAAHSLPACEAVCFLRRRRASLQAAAAAAAGWVSGARGGRPSDRGESVSN